MQRLLPFAKTLVYKTLVRLPPAAPCTSIFPQIFRHYSSSGGRFGSNDGGGKPGSSGPKDPWDDAWEPRRSKGFRWEDEDKDNDSELEDSELKDSSWSPGIKDEEFDDKEVVGRRVSKDDEVVEDFEEEVEAEGLEEEGKDLDEKSKWDDDDSEEWASLEKAIEEGETFLDSLEEKENEILTLMEQVREPGLRGAYLKDSEKQEMYRLHKENPEVYTVERLAKDFRVMRQRVHAILWLKEDEEEMEKRMGPLDDSVENLLDAIPEIETFPVFNRYRFIISADREFHVAQLPDNPDFRVMPEDWDGTVKDPDEMLWEISQKEDEILYQEFVQRMNFNKAQIAGKVKCHPYSRRRPSQGWKFTVEELGKKGKRGRGGGRKFVSEPDGSKRPLDELEKMFLKRETNRTRRKFI